MLTNKPQSITTQNQPQFRGRMAFNLMRLLLPLTIIPLVLMGSLAFNRARNLLLQEVSGRLDVYLGQATGHMDSWLLDKNLELDSLSRNNDFRNAASDLNRFHPNSSFFQQAAIEARDFLRSLNPVGMAALFNQSFIVNPDGDILVSHNRDWEGLTLNGQSYFEEKIAGQGPSSFITVAPAPFYSSENEETQNTIALVTTWPLRDSENNLLGYIIGLSEPVSIHNILTTDSSFLPENKMFLITDREEYIGITDLLKYSAIAPITPSNGQRELVQAGPSEGGIVSSYRTYDDIEVLGIYRFYPTLNLGIIVEVPQEAFLGGIDALTPYSIVIVTLTSILISGLIYVGSRRFTNPLRELSLTTRHFAEGDWQKRSEIDRTDEIGLLAYTFNQMAEELSQMYRSMEMQVDERTRQVITAAEVANLATSTTTLDDLLNQSVSLITERFGYYHASIFLIDDAKENVVLRGSTGSVGRSLRSQEFQIPLDVNSVVSWAANNNAPRIVSDVSQDSVYLKHELLPDTHSEISVPISIGNTILGVLDVQSKNPNAFQPSTVEVLVTLANQLASAIQNFRLVEGTEIDLQQINELYRASRQIAKANTPLEIYQAATYAIQQTSYISAIYISDRNQFRLIETPDHIVGYSHQLPRTLNISQQQAQSYLGDRPTVIRDVSQPTSAIHSELLAMPQKLGCNTAALLPIIQDGILTGIIIIATKEYGAITLTSIQPFASLVELITTALAKVIALQTTSQSLHDIQVLNEFNIKISNETNPEHLYSLLHEEINKIIGESDFYIALYDRSTDHIEIPYLFEGGEPIQVDSFPLGEGLTSIVIRTKQPLMLVENAEERAKALGAKVIGRPAKSWLGVPLIVQGEVIGIINVQDPEQEFRFTDEDLNILTTLATPIASAIHSARLFKEIQKRASQLQTTAEIARETSATLDQDSLLRNAIHLIRDRFNFYHASVFLLDATGEFAVVRESTGEAGRQMIQDRHKLAIGSQSIIGYVTKNREPLVVNDVTKDSTHRYNPLLPDTRAELGIPIIVGDHLLGAIDVQSTKPFAFSPDDIEILQILADQLAIAIANAELFTETQEHLAQHRLIHHVTTVAASSSGIEDALSSAVQGLRVTLGDRVAILLTDTFSNTLRVVASSGYEDDLVGLKIEVGQGITGWVAEHMEPLLINDVLSDPRYIPGKDSVRSELAVPLIYRGEVLGVLNIESDEFNAFDEHDQDILGTLGGSLAAIIVNARLTSRQRQLLEITNKIRRSVNMETILETTASELSKTLRTRKTRIQIGARTEPDIQAASSTGDNGSPSPNGEEGD